MPSKMAVTFESFGTVSDSHSVVTITLSCVISEMKRDVDRPRWVYPSEYCLIVCYGDIRMA